MKRLKLVDFQSKQLKKQDTQQVDQLLGQILGDCHDRRFTVPKLPNHPSEDGG